MSEGTAIQLDGVEVVGITAQLPTTPNSPTGTGTLYITVGKNPLPVEFTVKGAQGQETVKFTAWGTAVALVAPSAAVTAASLVPSTPA